MANKNVQTISQLKYLSTQKYIIYMYILNLCKTLFLYILAYIIICKAL